MKRDLMATIENAINNGMEMCMCISYGEDVGIMCFFTPEAFSQSNSSCNIYAGKDIYSFNINDVEYDEIDEMFVCHNNDVAIHISVS